MRIQRKYKEGIILLSPWELVLLRNEAGGPWLILNKLHIGLLSQSVSLSLMLKRMLLE